MIAKLDKRITPLWNLVIFAFTSFRSKEINQNLNIIFSENTSSESFRWINRVSQIKNNWSPFSKIKHYRNFLKLQTLHMCVYLISPSINACLLDFIHLRLNFIIRGNVTVHLKRNLHPQKLKNESFMPKHRGVLYEDFGMKIARKCQIKPYKCP